MVVLLTVAVMVVQVAVQRQAYLVTTVVVLTVLATMVVVVAQVVQVEHAQVAQELHQHLLAHQRSMVQVELAVATAEVQERHQAEILVAVA